MVQRIDLPALSEHDDYKRISPTDIAQYIRLEQCDRYLRLQLQSGARGDKFLRDYGVAPQSIPPLLTRSGAVFEAHVEQVVADRYPSMNLAHDTEDVDKRLPDNSRVISEVRQLAPDTTIVLFQSRLVVTVNGWQMRGDVDILRFSRDDAGALHVLIADMKSSTSTKVEHRLQVAFYLEMLAALFAEEGIDCAGIELGILYRGALSEEGLTPADILKVEKERLAAYESFGVPDALLSTVRDPDSYRSAIADLVTDKQSTAVRSAETPFEDVPYHLSYKCDGCLFNEFCMKWTAETDDLSLLPHLSSHEKSTLRAAGVTTTEQLANLKSFAPSAQGTPNRDLVVVPETASIVRTLSALPPVGERLDELVHRARRYRSWHHRDIEALSYIPSKGYGSLPYSDASHNPNLVRVYIDAQHDYLQDRIYMLGALVVGCEGGIEQSSRRRSVVHLTDGPPDSSEREEDLFTRWTEETLRAVVELAAPDSQGEKTAPIHLIFFNSFEQKLLLEGLGRHATSIFGATPLYDFVAQIAAYDSPVATFLENDIRELKNYPMMCQSLQAVAAYLKFNWNEPEEFRELFRVRLFDFWGKLDPLDNDETAKASWYMNRSRFNSQIPLEYAYAAWGDLPDAPLKGQDQFASYRDAQRASLVRFHARRLEALEHIAHDFAGNKQTEKTAFVLPDLATFSEKAETLAQAMDEFVTIERHVTLSDWKAKRLAPPERRALAGDTLVVRYVEEDQTIDVTTSNRENIRKAKLKIVYEAAFRAANPDIGKVNLPKEQKVDIKWSQEKMQVKLRIECESLDCDLTDALALTTLKDDQRIVLNRRLEVDSRLPAAEQVTFTPTAKQMLYGTRATIKSIATEPDGHGGTVGFVHVEMVGKRGGGIKGFVFAGREEPFDPDGVYTIDSDPNDWYGAFSKAVTSGLRQSEQNTLYSRIDRTTPLGTGPETWVPWSDTAASAQCRFLDGLDALHAAGAGEFDFEEGKRRYISGHGDDSLLLVQGPPGTGKSYSTAFAVLARMQGALADGQPYRVFLACKTHAATDVLLTKLAETQTRLRTLRASHSSIMDRYIDPRLDNIPLFRMKAKNAIPDGVTELFGKTELPAGQMPAFDALMAESYCVCATTPGGVYRMVKDYAKDTIFGQELCDCLVLDEASQMNLPEAMMAALLLRPEGQLIVVGDHRQMPPIVKHAWGLEPHRTFKQFRSYESLFLRLLGLEPPMIKFQESFRLHRDMAEFLRAEIYVQDNIPYFSRRSDELQGFEHEDAFVAAVLSPEHPIIVIVHDEHKSQRRNAYEQELITPLLTALTDKATYNLGAIKGLGVVVPHRAQRSALQNAVEALVIRDPATGLIKVSAVDTVERFQGDEREAIIVSATESDPQYILGASEFLLDPRRLTVALSRAEHKMVLVAARSVFAILSPDEETFDNSQLWKNLLRKTCTMLLWEGERGGHGVTVWGNALAN